MYKLVIADDELLVQIGIKSLLPWQEQDIEVVGTAANGKQAYALICAQQADIVITDIKMPVMDGMELIALCHKTLAHPPQFILLTSHEEFSLAKEAVQLRVVDYLVKLDLHAQALQNALERAKQNLVQAGRSGQSQQKLAADEQLQRLFKQSLHTPIESSALHAAVEQANPALTKNLCLLCCETSLHNCEKLIRKEEERIYQCVEETMGTLFADAFSLCVLPLQPGVFALLLCAQQTNASFGTLNAVNTQEAQALRAQITSDALRAIQVTSEYYNACLTIGCSGFAHVAEELAIMFAEARAALRNTVDNGILAFFADCAVPTALPTDSSFPLIPHCQAILMAWERQDITAIETAFSALANQMQQSLCHMQQYKDICHRVVSFLLNDLAGAQPILARAADATQSLFDLIHALQTPSKALCFLDTLARLLCDAVENNRGDFSGRLSVRTREYVRANLEKRLTLSETAEQLGVNASYLSSVFKKQNGIGFANYVNTEKVKRAMQMLADGNYKIYEVADLLSFENAYYFSKVFSKYVGISPKDYAANNPHHTQE